MNDTLWSTLTIGIGLCAVFFIVAFGWIVLELLQDYWRATLAPWLDRRRRSRELTDAALRHQEQKQVHQAVRKLVEADRQKLDLVARIGSKR